jgi:hypothetical protein
VYGSKKPYCMVVEIPFIPYYSGKYKTIELQPSVDYNGTTSEELSKEIIDHHYLNWCDTSSVFSKTMYSQQ